MPGSTLNDIEVKVRRLTRSPSTAQLSTEDLRNYINTFIVYDFPEHLRTFKLHTTFTFYTNPYQDEYFTDEASFGDAVANPTIVYNPLYNFQNKYLTVNPPVYISGNQGYFSQSPDEFFGVYPKIRAISNTGNTGDGATTTFTGYINSQQAILPSSNYQQNVGIVQRSVLFDTVDSNLNGLALVDVPVINATTGNPTVNGNLYDPASAAYQAALVTPPTTVDATNTINYATGYYTITFGTPPGADAPINSQTVPQALAIPRGVLYYANKFVIRPIPDQVYPINIEVYKRPTELLTGSQSPELEEYWQYIAYGAAKKIFEDRMDLDSVALIMPEFRKQENLCNRRTIVQITNQQVSTIYNQQIDSRIGNFWGGAGGGF